MSFSFDPFQSIERLYLTRRRRRRPREAEFDEEIAVSIVAELIKVRAEDKPSQEKKWKV